jgi:hypothetical protein
MPGRDTALGFLLRRLQLCQLLVAKEQQAFRRLLRFCNVGSFPQNDRRWGGLAKHPCDPPDGSEKVWLIQ